MLNNGGINHPTAYPLQEGWELIGVYADGEVEARYNAEADFGVLVDVDTDYPITEFTGLKGIGRGAVINRFKKIMGEE